MTVAVIFLAGEIADYTGIQQYTRQADIIICADGGSLHAEKMNIVPDIILGDMDSIHPALLEKYMKNGVETQFFKTDKDKTDSHLAIELALEKGCDRIILLGALGALPDHSLTNILLLEYIYNHRAIGMIATDNAELTITKGRLEINSLNFNRVSLIPVSEKVTGVTTTGLKYELKNDVLYRADSRGTSNCFIEDKATIDIREGVLLVIKVKEI